MVREVLVPAAMTFEDLFHIVTISYGIDEKCIKLPPVSFTRKEVLKKIPKEGGVELAIHLPFDSNDIFAMVQVEVLGEQEQEQCVPKVLWGCGYNIPEKARTLTEVNSWMLRFDVGEHLNLHPFYGYSDGKEFLFKIRTCNRKLLLAFGGENENAPKLKQRNLRPWIDLLLNKPEKEVKNIANVLGVGSYRGRGKVDYIRSLLNYINADGLEEILYELRLSEYEELSAFFRTGVYVKESLKTLRFYGLVHSHGNADAVIAKELLEAWENWEERDSRLEYLEVEEIVVAACRLYGFATLAMAEKLFRYYYPEQDFDEELYWEIYEVDGQNQYYYDLECGEDCIYSAENFSETGAHELMKEWEESSIEEYIPNITEMKVIAERGCGFFEESNRELLEFFTRISKKQVPLELCYITAGACHVSYPPEEVAKHVNQAMGLMSTGDKLWLIDFIGKHSKEVRQIRLKGYNEIDFPKNR